MEDSKKTNKIKKYIAIALVAVVIIAASFITYAWLTRDSHINNNTVISDFESQGFVYFLKGNETDNSLTLQEILANEPNYYAGNSLVSVNLTNPNAENYIGNLRVVLLFKGASPAYVRVRLLEQWTENDEFIYSVFPKYNIPNNENIFAFSTDDKTIIPTFENKDGTGWFDNRAKDLCYYYDAPLYPNENGGSVYMLCVNGISQKNIDEMTNLRDTVELNMAIEVQSVQPNRFREFFKLDKLPWE